MEVNQNRKRVRDDSEEPEVDSSEVKRFKDNIFDILVDDSDLAVNDSDDDVLDLDSVMRSFEEQISEPVPPLAMPSTPQQTSGSGNTQPDLVYLLEASDDELGLPPTTSSSASYSGVEERKEDASLSGIPAEVVGLSEISRFDDEFPSYGCFEYEIRDDMNANNHNCNNDDLIGFEGLYDYSDLSLVPTIFSDLPWRPESLPAL